MNSLALFREKNPTFCELTRTNQPHAEPSRATAPCIAAAHPRTAKKWYTHHSTLPRERAAHGPAPTRCRLRCASTAAATRRPTQAGVDQKVEGIAGQPRATQRRAPAKPHHRALPRDPTPARCQRQPADGFDTQPRPPRAGQPMHTFIKRGGRRLRPRHPRCAATVSKPLPGARDCSGTMLVPYPAGPRCARLLFVGHSSAAACPTPLQAVLCGSYAPSFGPARPPPRIGGRVRALASLRSSGVGGAHKPAPPPALCHSALITLARPARRAVCASRQPHTQACALARRASGALNGWCGWLSLSAGGGLAAPSVPRPKTILGRWSRFLVGGAHARPASAASACAAFQLGSSARRSRS